MQDPEPPWLTAVLALVEFMQVVALAYLAGQAKASGDERNRRRREEDVE